MEDTIADAPVRNLMALCRDILQKGVSLREKLYWCKRDSALHPGGAPNPVYHAPISLLVRRGILKRVNIGLHSSLRPELPDIWFQAPLGRAEGRYDTHAVAYIVQNRARLERMSTVVQAANEFLGLAGEGDITFDRAVARVRQEIRSHPDPTGFFFTVLRRLSPR